MMNLRFYPLLPIFMVLFLTACSKDDVVEEQEIVENPPAEKPVEAVNLEVEEFVYTGLNDIYLYKADVAVLADDYFDNDTDKREFLDDFSSPESLFDALLSTQDNFSFMTDDYNALEEQFKGVSSSTAGMKFGLGQISGTNNIFGFLQYVIPGSSADKAGLTRGTIFTEVDGQKLTLNNFSSLISSGSFTINVGKIENNTIVLTDETVTLNNNSYTENPVHLVKTIDVGGKKVGYLMYNSFVDDFDDELNDAFAELKSKGVTDLVLDLRYNGGGYVDSAIDLASMITGQFEGQVFMKEQWNERYQKYFEGQDPERLLNRFDGEIRTREAINSLNLTKVYILTTQSTASASELIINGLEPYIDVIQIGDNTTGKFQASVTLYDSDDFDKAGANPNHTYALQPLVFKSANAAGKSDYVDGLAPDYLLKESLSNLGTLGDPSEPLLQAALNHIQGKAYKAQSTKEKEAIDKFKFVGESNMKNPMYQRMYIKEVPPVLK